MIMCSVLPGRDLLPVLREVRVFLKTSHQQVTAGEFGANASNVYLVWPVVHSETEKGNTSCPSAHVQRVSEGHVCGAISHGCRVSSGIPVAGHSVFKRVQSQ